MGYGAVRDLGDDGAPFVWDEERRFAMRVGRDLAARLCASIFRVGRRFDLVPTRANSQPAFGGVSARPNGISHGTSLYVLTLAGDRVSAMTSFGNSMRPWFGLPRSLPSR